MANQVLHAYKQTDQICEWYRNSMEELKFCMKQLLTM